MSVLPFGVDNSVNEAALESLDLRVSALESGGGGGGGAALPISLDDTTDSTDRLALTPVERAKLATYAENDGKTGDAHAVRTDNPHNVTAAQVGAPTTAEFATATDAIAALDGRMDSVESTNSSQSSAISALETAVDNLSGGGGASATYGVMSITNAATNNAPILDKDVVFIEHSVDAFVYLTAALSKKPHTLIFLGNPKTITIVGAPGEGQTLKGSTGTGLSYASGTDASAATRTLVPDPDTTNFPNRWRIF